MSADIYVILDRSGSMRNRTEDVIGGFNAFLREQQAVKDHSTITLVQFDHEYEVVYRRQPVHKARELTDAIYQPRGSTALLDAMGRTVAEARSEQSEGRRMLFVIITDGAENASKEWTKDKVKKALEEAREHGGETLFIGANMDQIAGASQLGVRAVAQASLGAPIGVAQAFAGSSGAVRKYRGGTIGPQALGAAYQASSARVGDDGSWDDDLDPDPNNGLETGDEPPHYDD